MRIAIVDEKAEALGLAVALTREGHEVHHVSTCAPYARVGWGLLVKHTSFLPLMASSCGIDLYVVLARGLTVQAEALRRAGKAVIGGNGWVDRLEHDDAFARHVADSCGIKAPRVVTYPSAEEALAAVAGDVRKHVVTCGDDRSYASDVPALLANHIRRARATPVRVAEYVPGVELYVETWFHRGRNIFTLSALENRRFLDADMGPELDAQTCVAWAHSMLEPRVYQTVMKKLAVLVESNLYTGPLGARVVISDRDRKPYLLGFRARSLRHIHACRAVLGFDVARFWEEAAAPTKTGYAYSATLSVQPYPASAGAPAIAAHARGLAIIGGEKMFPHDTEADLDRPGELVVAGTSGLLGDVLGTGATVETARQDAIRRLDDIVVDGKQARRGGGAAHLARQITRLAAMGYETPRKRAEEIAVNG